MRTISEHQWYQWGEDPKRHPPSHAVCSDSEVPLDCRAASFHRLWDSMTDSSWWWWCPDASNCSPAAPRSHSSSHWKLSGYGRRTHSCSLQNECAEDRHRVCLKLVLARRIQSDSFRCGRIVSVLWILRRKPGSKLPIHRVTLQGALCSQTQTTTHSNIISYSIFYIDTILYFNVLIILYFLLLVFTILTRL